jgi:hypothetical protein
MISEVYRPFPDHIETEPPWAKLLTGDIVSVALVVVDGHYIAVME